MLEAIMNKRIVFNDIFPNYETFVSWYEQYGVPVISKLTFTLIQCEYRDSSIAYTEQGFKDHFFIDLYTYSKEFEETTKAIDKLMDLTDEDIAVSGSTILNVADTPETENSTDVEITNYISQQQKTIMKKGNLQVKREQLSNKRTYTVKTFLRRFKHLFRKILSQSFTPVVEENIGD